MRIAVDAMGGDHAPREIIRGVADGVQQLSSDDQIILYGPEDTVAAECRACELTDPRVVIEHCSQVIEMHDSPVEALKQKRDSAMVKMASAAGKGRLDALISAGNTGAFVAACQLRIRTIKGVSRPGIAIVMPTFFGPRIICDVGANPQPKPHHLHEYAHMAALYAQALLGAEQPKVGLMSIGEEGSKGNPLVKEAHRLLKEDPVIQFIGNVEGQDIFLGEGDVFVCDGFMGNVILKLTEGLAEGLFKTILKEIKEEDESLMGRFAPIVDRIWARHDFAEYGGAPLLGINSTAIICHGRSDHRAISNAIRAARETIAADLNAQIAAHMTPASETTA